MAMALRAPPAGSPSLSQRLPPCPKLSHGCRLSSTSAASVSSRSSPPPLLVAGALQPCIGGGRGMRAGGEERGFHDTWQGTRRDLWPWRRALIGPGRGASLEKEREARSVAVRAGRWWNNEGGGYRRGGMDEFGSYPWEEEDEGPRLEWVQEDSITLITDSGVVKLGGSKVPRLVQGEGRRRVETPPRRFREEDFMDPHQQLCLGALFDIAATNGLDMGRRFCIIGFCRSVEMLSAVVEDTVKEQGGEIVVLEKQTMEGLHEKLHLTVAIPLLWGVPPALDTLNHAIRSGGGIVDKVYRQWEFL